jgi:hypothetical protein
VTPFCERPRAKSGTWSISEGAGHERGRSAALGQL